MPALAATVVVPPRGLVALLMVTSPLNDGVGLPYRSSDATAKPKPLPPVTLLGGAVITKSWLGAAGSR